MALFSNRQITRSKEIYTRKPDPRKLVLGYFSASAKTAARVIVNDSDVPGNVGPINCTPSQAGCIPAACIDCRKWPGSNVKPDYWPN